MQFAINAYKIARIAIILSKLGESNWYLMSFIRPGSLGPTPEWLSNLSGPPGALQNVPKLLLLHAGDSTELHG